MKAIKQVSLAWQVISWLFPVLIPAVLFAWERKLIVSRVSGYYILANNEEQNRGKEKAMEKEKCNGKRKKNQERQVSVDNLQYTAKS